VSSVRCSIFRLANSIFSSCSPFPVCRASTSSSSSSSATKGGVELYQRLECISGTPQQQQQQQQQQQLQAVSCRREAVFRAAFAATKNFASPLK
jgi:hypothetical protein